MTPMVLLRHTPPDAGAHFDWMFARRTDATPDSRELLTFRVGARVDRIGRGEVVAERLPDHRTAYLEYEGPVSGNRGEVARVAWGECEIALDGPDRVEARIRWRDGVEAAIVAERLDGGGRFLVRIEPIVDATRPENR